MRPEHNNSIMYLELHPMAIQWSSDAGAQEWCYNITNGVAYKYKCRSNYLDLVSHRHACLESVIIPTPWSPAS